MYNRNLIDARTGLVGFENSANPAYAMVNTTNQTSRSSRYFTDNPYCKIEYILDCMDYKDASGTQINTNLTKIQRVAFMNVCDELFNNEDYLERDLMYPYEQNKINLETLPAGFVGWRIFKKAGIAFQINRIFCEFSNEGIFTLYLFSSNQPTALESQEITVSTIGFQDVSLTGWIVDNTVNYDGHYFLGYIKNDLIPYKRDYCNSDLKAYFKHLAFERIYVPGHSSDTLFNQDDIDGLSENPGINPDISVYRDYTDLIIRNENLFATAVQLAGQIEILRLIISSGRSNPTERITKQVVDKLLFELEGNPELKIYGLKNKYNQEIKKLKNSFNQTVGFKLHIAS
jgi:hypothetical protein